MSTAAKLALAVALCLGAACDETNADPASDTVRGYFAAVTAGDCNKLGTLSGGKVAANLKRLGCNGLIEGYEHMGLELVVINSEVEDGRDRNARIVRAVMSFEGKGPREVLLRVEREGKRWVLVPIRVRILALVVTIAVGCDAAPTLSSRALAIRAGAAAPDDRAVVAIGATPVGCTESLDVQCTGTLIAPRAVLTAAHCARVTGRLAVFVGGDVTGPGEIHDVVSVIVHPSYVEGVADADLAVLVLATSPDVAPLAVASAPVDAADAGRTARAVGFGAIDEMGNGTGVRRQGTGVVSATTGATFRTTPAPGITCNGDSGGPVLLDRGGGEVVAGVTSQGDLRCETYADNVDVAAHRAFIDEAVATAMAWTPNGGDVASCKPGCVTDDDCAFGYACEVIAAGDVEGLCVLAPLPPGTLDGDCARDDQCASGSCARVPGEQACRCLVPCDAEDDRGCRAHRGTPGLAVLVLVTLFGLRVGRARRA